MKTKFAFGFIAAVMIVGLALSVLAPVQSVFAAAPDGRGGPGGSGGPGGTRPGPAAAPLSEQEKSALKSAILEEYGAYNLYNGVISQLGSVYPFNTIVRAEQQHINALVRQAQKYGVTVPANPGLAAPTQFKDLAAACQAGVKAETADAALYDQLKPVTTHTDLLQVYNNLQNASLKNHLPAFQTCD